MIKFITADLHLNHKNICGPLVSEWSHGYRNFSSLDEMNNKIIDSINYHVRPYDELIIIGDIIMGPKVEDNLPKFMDMINCRNVHLIYGNHDKKIRKNSSLQKLFISCQDYMEVRYNREFFTLFHYPLQVWNKHHHGSIMLHGHCHGTLADSNRKIIDVGWDVWKRPLSLEELTKTAKSKTIKIVDHHDKETRE